MCLHEFGNSQIILATNFKPLPPGDFITATRAAHKEAENGRSKNAEDGQYDVAHSSIHQKGPLRRRRSNFINKPMAQTNDMASHAKTMICPKFIRGKSLLFPPHP